MEIQEEMDCTSDKPLPNEKKGPKHPENEDSIFAIKNCKTKEALEVCSNKKRPELRRSKRNKFPIILVDKNPKHTEVSDVSNENEDQCPTLVQLARKHLNVNLIG